MKYISEWIKQHSVLAFYILTFTISWLGYLPQVAYSYGLFPFQSILFFIIGGLGPTIAAAIVMFVLHGKNGVRKLFTSLAEWQVSIIWYTIALFLHAVVWFIVIGLPNGIFLDAKKIAPLFMLLPIFLANMFMNVWEEIGWRGFALPKLQLRYTALVSSLIVGAMWGLWHLPLLVMKDYPMSTYLVVPFFIGATAASVLYAWIYNNTKGSLLMVTIFHAAGNTTGFLLGEGLNSISGFLYYEAVVLSIIAVAIIIVFGQKNLSRSFKRVIET